VGDGSRQADAASPLLPFCAVGRQDTMPSPMPGWVRGALGHSGCSALAPTGLQALSGSWKDQVWVSPQWLCHRAKLWKRSG